MKNIKIVTALLWFLPLVNSAQESPVFQVLHADSAFRKNVNLEPLDTLRQGDMIRSIGLLILVHQTGEFISIEGDTLLDVQKMDSLTLTEKGMIRCENEFPDFRLLLSIEKDWQTGSVGAVLAGGLPELEFINPRSYVVNRAFPNQKVAIWWKALHPDKIDSFKVNFVNIFDDEIGSEVTNDSFIELEMKQFQVPHNTVIVQVSDVLYPKVKSEDVVFGLDSMAYFMPDSFEANTAVEALGIAYYLERNSGYKNGYEEATSYYTLATKLSSHLFYKSMLQNHNKRGIVRR